MRERFGTAKACGIQQRKQERSNKDLNEKVNFMAVLTHVKNNVEAFEEVERVAAYKKLLKDDMRERQDEKL